MGNTRGTGGKQNIQDNITIGLKRFPGQQFLYGYYGNPLYRRLDEPVGTIPTVDTWALITPASTIEGTLHRMLSHEEVKLAMGFPEEYQILGNDRQKKWQLGNAVCSGVMVDILKRCTAVLEPEMERVA